MPGKRIQFDDETWQAVSLLALDRGVKFQALAEEAFRDLLKKQILQGPGVCSIATSSQFRSLCR
jgi:hypothetical protein